MKRLKAFTLVELLVVIGIVVLLVALLIPQLTRVKENVYRAICRNNCSLTVKAVLHYANDWNGKPLVQAPESGQTNDEYAFWGPKLAPYFGVDSSAYDKYKETGDKTYKLQGDRLQPWFGTTACPAFRYVDIAMQEGDYFVLNYRYCHKDFAGTSNVFRIQKADNVFLALPSTYAGPHTHIEYARDATIGGMWTGGQIHNYPRHWREGANFGFADGHVEWRALKDGLTAAWRFLPTNPQESD